VKSLLHRRPSPAIVISIVALFLSLGGISYGVATGSIDSREIRNNDVRTRDLRNNDVRTRDLRNNEVRGRDIRNSTIQGRDVALNTLTGDDVSETSLGQVPSAADAAGLGGKPAGEFVDRGAYVRFSARLSAGQTVELARNGSVSVHAECSANGNDTVRLLAASAVAGAVMGGVDDLDGGSGGTFGPTTPAASRVLMTLSNTAPGATLVRSHTVPEDPAANSGGFVLGPDGAGLHLVSADSAVLGLDFAGARCIAAGLLVPTG
jgi:hypothetical protein